MDFKDTSARSVWLLEASRPGIGILDQRHLPHRLVVEELYTQQEVFEAIRAMHTRGAPLIGAVAAYGVWLAAVNDSPEPGHLMEVCRYLDSARPTAVNLAWALNLQRRVLESHRHAADGLAEALLRQANSVAEEDVLCNASIGRHGLELIRRCHRANPDRPVRILTHCNAGWLATVAWGTATAPIYMAHDEGIPLQVWVDETRPRNQGAQLTAWELGQRGVAHTLVADNAGGHLMQRGEVDLVLVGTDRTTRSGDVANKIGTYLKALAARDNGVPFYVALPSSTIDWSMHDGMAIPIEERSGSELQYVEGLNRQGEPDAVRICPAGTPAANPAFDVTPARLVSGLITERGICEASEAGLLHLFPERRLAETAS
jgi:methylthioribose-1-phosphate isomerase